jgi:hypothetical protein
VEGTDLAALDFHLLCFLGLPSTRPWARMWMESMPRDRLEGHDVTRHYPQEGIRLRPWQISTSVTHMRPHGPRSLDLPLVGKESSKNSTQSVP